MSVEITSADKTRALSLSTEVFGETFNEGLVHQSVVAYLANARKWTAKRKSRSDARGGGAKPWRQKGTGRARAGTIRSPIWVGGGKTFAPKEINFSQKTNKKMHKKSMKSLLSELVRTKKLKTFEAFELESVKTKDFLEKVSGWDLNKGRTLVVFQELNENIYLSSRNLAQFDVVDCYMINSYMLLSYDNIVIEKNALKSIEERLQ